MSKNSSTKKTGRGTSKAAPSKVEGISKLDALVTLLRQPTGASIDELASATAWQKHSVRGALAGILKKKGHFISSEVVEGVRRYRIVAVQV
ncbi:MAG TPA: DUF3489 domain-containing protein [Sphingomicrobium sp.]|nr:DUF3489 domain-containing protein [Sphingomicrobium sp.]